ncbi:hypothetical protein [Aeromonas tecta]|uniref:hypothetical protein n=1 Tax=Aeromonas tecta TaxID=324617 RepID=UPI00068233CB|nr:hypothetical protein [Aeromonas tecta]
MNANPQPTTFYGVHTEQNWTHVHLLNGSKGREVSRCDGEVVIQADAGWAQPYDEDQLHLFWAPLARDSQGENA